MKGFCIAPAPLFLFFLFVAVAPDLAAEDPPTITIYTHPPTEDEAREIQFFSHRVIEFVATGPFADIRSAYFLVAINPRAANFQHAAFQPASEWGEFSRDFEYLCSVNWGSSPMYAACTIHRRSADPIPASGAFVVARFYVPGSTYHSFRFLQASVWDSKGLVRGARIFARDPSAKIRPHPKSLATTWSFIKSRL